MSAQTGPVPADRTLLTHAELAFLGRLAAHETPTFMEAIGFPDDPASELLGVAAKVLAAREIVDASDAGLQVDPMHALVARIVGRPTEVYSLVLVDRRAATPRWIVKSDEGAVIIRPVAVVGLEVVLVGHTSEALIEQLVVGHLDVTGSRLVSVRRADLAAGAEDMLVAYYDTDDALRVVEARSGGPAPTDGERVSSIGLGERVGRWLTLRVPAP